MPLPAPVTNATFICRFGTDGPFEGAGLQGGQCNRTHRTPSIRRRSNRGSDCAHAHPELLEDRSIPPSMDAPHGAASDSNRLQPTARNRSPVAALRAYFADTRPRLRIRGPVFRSRLRARGHLRVRVSLWR